MSNCHCLWSRSLALSQLGLEHVCGLNLQLVKKLEKKEEEAKESGMVFSHNDNSNR